MAGLWPFGGGSEPVEAPTVGSLPDADVVIDEQASDPADSARAMEAYERFLDAADPAQEDLVATAIRRLADLSLEMGEALQLDEGLSPAAEARLARSVALYQRLLTDYPDHAESDRVLYQQARALELLQDPAAAQAALDQAVALRPDGELAAEAQFRRGEAFFMARDWVQAEDAYAEVIALGPDSAFYEQALYKHGWSRFKQSLHQESLDSFFAVLDRQLVTEGRVVPVADLPKARRETVEDALRAISIGFTYLEGADSLDDYLDQRGRVTPYESLLYRNLGGLYLGQERYHDAANTYHAYVERAPLADDAPTLQVAVANAFAAGAFTDRVLEAKVEFVERFGFDGDWMAVRDGSAPDEVRDYLRSALGELARHFHAVAQASGLPGDYTVAAEWYRRRLNGFPDDPEAAEFAFLLAEALDDGGRTLEAAAAYEQMSRTYAEDPRAPEAGYAAVLAYRSVADTDGQDVSRLAAIEAGLRFADAFPAHEHAVAVRADAAEALFDSGDLIRAADQADLLASMEPPISPVHLRTALLVLGHARFDTGGYEDAENAYRRLLTVLAAGDEERAPVRERLAASIYSQGRAQAAAGATDAAVEHYLRVALEIPDSPIAATADYDAAVLLMGAGRWAEATVVLEQFRGRYPDHALGDEVTVNLARTRLEAGDRSGAAEELVAVSLIAGESGDVRRAALWQAGELYGETGQTGKALDVLEDYVARFPEPFDAAMDARLKLADLHGELGDTAGRSRWLEQIMKADAAAGEAATARSRTLAGRAALELAEPRLEAFEQVALTAPLDKSLPAKKKRMEEALAAYERAAGYGITDVTTQSTYRIASIYGHFGAALMDSERPPELGPLELEQYEILLEEQAYPFEEQAIALHEANVARTRAAVYDEWVVASFDRLAELMPGRYARMEEGERLVDLIE